MPVNILECLVGRTGARFSASCGPVNHPRQNQPRDVSCRTVISGDPAAC